MTEFEDFPELTAPVLVGAFEGWNDAGDGATSGVEHLELPRAARERIVVWLSPTSSAEVPISP